MKTIETFVVISKSEVANQKEEFRGDLHDCLKCLQNMASDCAIKAVQREGGDSITLELRRLDPDYLQSLGGSILFKTVHIHNWQN